MTTPQPQDIRGRYYPLRRMTAPTAAAALAVATTSIANVVQGVQVRRWLIATGGGQPYTWSVISGSLPAGLALAADGTLSGTPTGTGASSFTVQVTDANSHTATAALSVTSVSAPFTPGSPVTAGGITTYSVTSLINGNDAESVRVLPPVSPSGSYPHGFLITLPVEAGTDGTTYGNGLDTAQTLGLHNSFNLTVVEPSSFGGSWWADNPSNANLLQETYLLQVVAWAQANYATTGTEKIYLIGLSRSATGGHALLLHHPDVYQAAASWDGPFMMTTYDGTDSYHGTVGGAPASSYGTQDNFDANYRLSPANLAKWLAGTNLGTVSRVWIGGFNAFQADEDAYDLVLTSAGILHTYSSVSQSVHAWNPTPGWMSTAVGAIVLPATTAGAGLAPGTGTALQPSVTVTANAGLAAGTGTALAPVPSVTAAAGLAAGAGSALQPAITVAAPAVLASAAGTAGQPGASVTAPAGLSAAAGAALTPVPQVTVLAGLATSAGTALQPTVQTTGSTTANAGLAAAAGSALAPVPVIAPAAGLAAATGTALAPLISVTPAAGLASGTGSALAPVPVVTAPAGLASASGAALAPVPVVTAAAGLAAGTGTALQPVVQTSGSTTASAGLASASGTAQQPAAGVQPGAGLAAGLAAAQSPAAAITASPALAVASGSAPVAVTAVTVTAGLATGTGGAPRPVAVVQVSLGLPGGTGTAQQPGITVTVVAGLASATGTALNASGPSSVPALLFSVVNARRLWSVTTARRLWSVARARNGSE